MNTCPGTLRHTDRKGRLRVTRCGGWLEFIGISRHRLYGWRRWARCTSPYCGLYVATAEWGDVAVIQQSEPPRAVFPSRGLVSFDEARAA